ncbi:DNA alkylation repair protein [Embleya scabrispora]|uniref:DNA alkylation repair protein n=1 Tax=Embleya scabrispora TaxID=159449 RepID=UPI0003659CC1|nr:DNA alkylation repair protein [Embleya scabrispora]MYS82322.1 DNA alkylation repair protein [Streptomyces sp. SID5474]
MFDAEEAAATLVATLAALGTPERAEAEKAYLKSDLTFLGVTVPVLRKAVTSAARARPEPSRDELLAWVAALWARPVHESRFAAIELMRVHVRVLTRADLPLVERLIRDAAGWVYVDTLAEKVAGVLMGRAPADFRTADTWAGDNDFWVRRAALLSLLPGARAGNPDLVRFDRYADAMLDEREFFIRKAIGWLLREISKRDPAYVIAWTTAHRARMSGVTFREAVRRLPTADAERLRATG